MGHKRQKQFAIAITKNETKVESNFPDNDTLMEIGPKKLSWIKFVGVTVNEKTILYIPRKFT